MPVYDTFSKRQKRLLNRDSPDVFIYDPIPNTFRVQICHIISDHVHFCSNAAVGRVAIWEEITNILCREFGLFHLGQYESSESCEQYKGHILCESRSTDEVLDMIDVALSVIQASSERLSSLSTNRGVVIRNARSAIDEVNQRFYEHGLGYQFLSGKLIRVDSTYLHVETVKPALELLHSVGFSGPIDEFQKAHEHHRHGRNKEAIAEALKAFESTMRAICEKRNWTVDKTATAKGLLQSVLDKELVPRYLQDHFVGLQKTLEAGIPTLRNKTSGHGQGLTSSAIEDHLVAYALHLAATNIVLLVEAYKALP